MKTKKIIALALCGMIGMQSAFSFCGFFVAKSDGKLFNKTSQIVFARDGNRSVITMAQDYQGALKDFAMVIPVPVVLKRSDIKTVAASNINLLDQYSAPRVAEYYDQSPCRTQRYDNLQKVASMQRANMTGAVHRGAAVDHGVTVEAEYEVDEYDILILSAKESSGLKAWLDENGYQIPDGAEEVLEPYIKSDMKFFVAKVGLERTPEGTTDLTPLQIGFDSPKFMLPIRLGMANADGDQNMQVFMLTQGGRVETTNYRTEKMKTDVNIPEFASYEFDDFYKKLFDRTYKKSEGKNVFLEYAWDIGRGVSVKCDPCVSPPVPYAILEKFGVLWDKKDIFITRMRVRYNRENFPQDLKFQKTSNKERYQCRYVIHRTSSGPFNCNAATGYFKKVIDRRNQELANLEEMTGQTLADFPIYDDYVSRWERKLNAKTKKNEVVPVVTPQITDDPGSGTGAILLYSLIALTLIGTGFYSKTLRGQSIAA